MEHIDPSIDAALSHPERVAQASIGLGLAIVAAILLVIYLVKVLS